MIELHIQDEGHNWVYRLGDRDRVQIGRAPTNEIQIRANRASRVHCQIEKTGGGYKLVDLESRNGTRVNDAVVNSRVLAPGDRIQIGETVIQFGALPEPEMLAPKAAAPERAAAPVEDPEIHTVRLEKRPSHHRPAAPLPRKSSTPWEILFIGGGVLGAIIIGTLIYNWTNAGRERETMLKAAEAAWSELDREPELGTRISRMQEVLEKYRTVARLYPGTREGAAAESRLKSAEPEHRHLSRWYKAYQDVLQSRRLAGDVPDLDQLMDWEARLKTIERDCPYGAVSAQAGLERENIVKGVDDAAQRLLEAQRKDLEVTLAAEDFTTALMRWEIFRERYGRFPVLVKAVDEEVAGVHTRVTSSLDEVTRKVDRLIEEKRYAEATALLERSRERFLGTDAAAKVSMKAQVVTLLSRGEANVGKAEEQVRAREQFYMSAADADAFAKRREFGKAIAAYRDILGSTTDADVKAEFGRRVEELSGILSLQEAFIRKATSGSLKGTEWTLGPGTVVKVDGADGEWVYFSLPTHSGKTQKRWKAFSGRDLCRLLDLAADGPAERYFIALFCFRTQMEDQGEQILAEIAAADGAFQSRINETLAQVRGVPVPRGGFVVYKGRWYTMEDRDRAVEDDKIAALVETILKKPVGEISGAVGRLSAIPRGREPLVQALHTKRDLLKKQMGKDLKFDNATLLALKVELDKRRCEALDFIEDEARYPDKKKMEAEGRAGEYQKIQKEEVDTRVKAVREIWENPYSAALGLNPAAKAINEDLKKVVEWLAREDKEFDAKKADEVDGDYVASLANTQLNIKTFSTETKEQKLIAYNLAVMEWNETNKTATPVERDQVRITNEYRWMLGRRCVKIEEALTKAARGHSAYMTKTGKFAHVIPGEPEGETPQERCRNAGYTSGGTSENISYNHTDPLGTFVAWYNSSGHHRNMINRNWAVLGAGFDGPHWTQNFGSNDTTQGLEGSPGTCGWPGLDFRGGRAKRKD